MAARVAGAAGAMLLAVLMLALAPGASARTGLAGSRVAQAAALGPAPAGAPLALVFPLAADDRGLEAFARAVSTPGSPRYGHFATVAQLARRFGARAAVAHAAVDALRRLGATAIVLSPTRMYVQATLTVARAERAFATELERLRAADGARFIGPAALARPGASAAAAAPHLPGALRGLVTGVVGLDSQPLAARPQLQSLRRRGAHAAAGQPPSAYLPRTGTPSGCASGRSSRGFTPNQYLAAYGFDPLLRGGLRGGGLRVALIEIDGFKGSDIRTFDRCFHLHTPRIRTFTVGFHRALAPGGETTLDLELLSAAAPRLSSLDVYENKGDAAHVLRALTAPLVARRGRPQVVSASLGICEPFVKATMGLPGIRGIERDLAMAAASGITVLASAGDQGSSACVFGDGQIADRAAVSYPASSPYVTGVGGTNFRLDRANRITGEVVWNDTSLSASAGGGGFSTLFARPAYQDGTVTASSRVVPDLAMLSDLAPGYAIYCTARGDRNCHGWSAVGGTSAATPLLAGGLTLVDQYLRRHRHHDLGFANPLLYRLATTRRGVFADVTAVGNDLGPWLPGSGGHSIGCCAAAPGFDAASGWGSVNLTGLAHGALAAAGH